MLCIYIFLVNILLKIMFYNNDFISSSSSSSITLSNILLSKYFRRPVTFLFFPQKMLLICSWSDSQSSSSDYVHVFMYSFIEKAEAENTRVSHELQYVCSKRNHRAI